MAAAKTAKGGQAGSEGPAPDGDLFLTGGSVPDEARYMVSAGEEDVGLNALIPADSDGIDVVQRALARVRETYFLSLTLEERAHSLRQAQRVEAVARAAGNMDAIVLEAKQLIVEMKRSVGLQVPALTRQESGAKKGKGKAAEKGRRPGQQPFSRHQLSHCRKLAEVPARIVFEVFRNAAMDEGWRVPSEKDIIRAGQREAAEAEGEGKDAEREPEDYVYNVDPLRLVVPGKERRAHNEKELLDACTSFHLAITQAAYAWTQGAGQEWLRRKGDTAGTFDLSKGSMTLTLGWHVGAEAEE